MSATYKWKPGSRINLDPQVVGEELEEIRRRHNGRIDRDNVLDEAKRESSPLHTFFEWDDEIAANEHRLEQARLLIRQITVTVRDGQDNERDIRAFVSVTIGTDNERAFMAIEDALSDPHLRRQVLANAFRELEAWRERHSELVEFAQIFSAIETIKI